jgi:hypothetical protein
MCQSRPNAPQQKKHRYSITSSARAGSVTDTSSIIIPLMRFNMR